MRRDAPALCAIFLVLVGFLSAFSHVAEAQAAGDAISIVQRANSAMGCGSVGKDTTIAVKGTLTVEPGGSVMPVSIQSQGNNRWRSELDTPKEHKVTIINDGKGQMQHADGHVTWLANHNTSHQRPEHVPCLTNLGLPPGQADATYLRSESVSGDLSDVIELSPANRPNIKRLADRMKTTMWVSRTTGYLTKMQYVNGSERDFNDAQTVEIQYSDYRNVDGLAVPFHQVTHDGALTLDLHLDSVQLNTPAADFTLR